MVYIVPDDYTDQATAPVGTGPFRFVSRSVQQNLVMEKFADYWGEGASLDKVTFQIFEDSNALMSALSAESVDMAVHLTIDQVNTIGEGTYKTLEGTMNLVQALYLNNNVEPFNNEQVRQGPVLCHRRGRDHGTHRRGPRHQGGHLHLPPPSPSTTMRASTTPTPMTRRRPRSCSPRRVIPTGSP